jgi:hypothetical protein
MGYTTTYRLNDHDIIGMTVSCVVMTEGEDDIKWDEIHFSKMVETDTGTEIHPILEDYEKALVIGAIYQKAKREKVARDY